MSQKALLDLTVHMELPDAVCLLQMMSAWSSLLLPLPGAPRADLLRPFKQKPPRKVKHKYVAKRFCAEEINKVGTFL